MINNEQKSNRGGRRPGSGRPKGSPNKFTADIKAMIDGALQAVGGQKYLEEQARSNPTAFLGLVGKSMPKDIRLGAGLSLEVNLVGVDRSARDQLPPSGSRR